MKNIHWIRQLVLIVGLFVVSGAGATALFYFAPKPVERPARDSAFPVEVEVVHRTSRSVVVSGFGVVRSKSEVELRSEVSGVVREVHPSLFRGGVVRSGEPLVRIDARNYEHVRAIEEAILSKALLDLEIERSEGRVARAEWELALKESSIPDTLEEKGGAQETERLPIEQGLIVREPQLREREAAVAAARARVARAKLDVERTTVKAPFDGFVLQEMVEVGGYVAAGTTVARLVASDEYEVELRVPVQRIQDLRYTRETGEPEGSVAIRYAARGEDPVRADHEGGEERSWRGRVRGVVGDVDPVGRMAGVVVSVSPLARSIVHDEHHARLLLGMYVEGEIEGRAEERLYPIPNRALREGHTVWVLTENAKLSIARVETRFSEGGITYVTDESGTLPEEFQVIVSSIPTPLEGMALTILTQPPSDGSPEIATEAKKREEP